jgi:hypothetical protein
MTANEIDEAEVFRIIVRKAPISFEQITRYLRWDGPGYERRLDRTLQRLRRRGMIRYSGGGWAVCS